IKGHSLGTDVRLTRSDVCKGHPEYYQDYALRLSKEISGAYYIDQFNNLSNSLAHTTTTGPEIWQQMEHNVDAVVVGVGSGGTLGGLSQYFKEVSPNTEFVLADPKGSVLADYVEYGHYDEAGSWFVEGIGEDFIPPLGDFSQICHAYRIMDAEAFSCARELLLQEGILAGSSSGTLLAAALRYCRAQKTPKRVVTLACDSGNKYLSKMFNDYWLLEQGLRSQQKENDLSDYVTYRYRDGATVFVSPQDTLQIAHGRMRLYDISQLPVLDNGQVVGIIDEWDLMHAIQADSRNFSLPVSQAMTSQVNTLHKKAPLEQLVATFDAGHVALIVDDGNHFIGLVTRTDVLNAWRQQLN
uniref:pyridoxal-phosphate dependent enzyme n=1 Tax=Xenorhabdus cabanillasii TaxID=351673 RepID=UPI0005715BBE